MRDWGNMMEVARHRPWESGIEDQKDQAQALMILGLEAITETRSTGSKI